MFCIDEFVFRADQQTMASTSIQLQGGAHLSSRSRSCKYDVFLSFRGADTRNGFVDHLYSALHEKVIFTFKDDQRLERGESISPTLLKAIEESRFAVIVFSENYVSSKWCLEELVKILECQKAGALTVLPVFYKVDSSNLRKQKGNVGETFTKHERDASKEEDKQKVQRWRNAVTEIANLSGWDSKTHGAEAKLVRDIAIDILHRLGYNGSNILEDVVGLHPRIATVMSLLEMRLNLDDRRIVGIYGMGGIGKTTIAQAVYHQIRTQFQASCYLPNVREAAEKYGLNSLQKSFFCQLHSVSDSDIKIRNIDLRGTIRNAVQNKRVLVVLDDVDRPNQLDALVGRLDWFGPGSRVIITTRDSHLLAKYGPRSHVYKVERLNDEEAFKLFCCKAFWNDQPIHGYEGLINEVVRYAGGVPLALQVLGSFLVEKSIIEWQSAVDKLRQWPNAEIQEVLKLSYDGLDHEEREIFLDIACFFRGKNKDYVIEILHACGFHADIGIRVLEDKALITITDNVICMHDLIQEMGGHVVNEEFPKEPGRRSRLWKYEDIYHALTKKTGTEAVEAIVLDSHETKEISLSPDTFSKMSNLRLLKLSNVQLSNGLHYLSNNLRLLDWHGYPLKCLPSNFQPDNLVKLKMSHSCLKQQPWNGRMCLDKLKYVDFRFSRCITKNLDCARLANLKELILQGCKNLVKFQSIEAIKKLTVLNLRDCKSLKVLSTGCWLKSLELLDLSDCSKLKNVSEVLTFTECLTDLYLSGTRVKELPIEHLSNLRSISLKDCKELTSLPSGICGLKLLGMLIVSGCSKLNKLPENLGGLERLELLDADFTAIMQPPSSITHLNQLSYLSFKGCKGPVTSIPWNSRFLSIPIREVRQDPMSFKLLSLSGLRSLCFLDLSYCNFSEGFLPNDLGSLSYLDRLDLIGTNIISLPPSIGDLPLLSDLNLTDCKKLKTVPYLPKNIHSIDVSGCTSLETLPDSTILPKRVVHANLSNCHTLIKNRPGLPFELLRSFVKQDFNDVNRYIVVLGREIPKYFRHQNNMGNHVRVRLMSDWYQRLEGFVVCVVFEATPHSLYRKGYRKGRPCSIDLTWNGYARVESRMLDDVDFIVFPLVNQFRCPPNQLVLSYKKFDKSLVPVECRMLTDITFHFMGGGIFTLVKCGVHAIYEGDEEWSD